MKKKLTSLLLAVLCLHQLSAQTTDPPTTEAAVSASLAVTPGPITGATCMPYTGTQVYSVPAMLGVRYLWQVVEGAAHTRIVSGQNTNRVSVQSIDEGTSVLRVYAYIGLVGGECTDPYREVEIRKVFPINNADALTGPTCMDASMTGAGAVIMYGVKPYLGSYTNASDYAWTLSPGLQELYRSTDGSTIFLKITNSSVDQQVSVTIGGSCNGNSHVFSKTLKALAPAPTFASGSFCLSDSIGTIRTFSITNNPTGSIRYRWLLPDNWNVIAANGADSTQVTIQFNDAGRGNITVMASNAGCGNRFSSFSVNRYPAVAPPIAGPECVAFGNTTPLTYRIPGGANTYRWEVFPSDAGWTVSGNGPSVVITPTFTAVPASGQVEVRATIQGDCGSAPVTSRLLVTVGPDKPQAISGPTCIAYGTTLLTYTIAAVPRATGYQWEIPATWSVSGATNTTAITVNPNNTSGTLRVVALGCSPTASSAASTLTVTAGPATPGTISGPVCVAYNATGILYSINAVADAVGYQWEVPQGWAFSTSPDQRTITISSTNNTSGTLRVKALGCNAAANSGFRTLAVSIGPAQPGSIAGPTCISAPGSVEHYSVTPVADASGYAWRFPAGWTIQGNANGFAVAVLTGNTPGTVAVQALGCNAETASPVRALEIIVAPAKPGAIRYAVNGSIGNTCIRKAEVHTVTFTIDAVSGADGYAWTFPASWSVSSVHTAEPSVTVTTDENTDGTVTVQATHASGCNSMLQSLEIIRSGLDFCIDIIAPYPGYRAYYIAPANVSNGTAVYFRWYTGTATTPVSEGANVNAYFTPEPVTADIRVVVTDQNGCETMHVIPATAPINSRVCHYATDVAARTASTPTAKTIPAFTAHEQTNDGITLYPNPAATQVTVTLPESMPHGSLMIYTAGGKLIESRSDVTNSIILDVSQYIDGMYYVSLSSTTGIHYTKLIVMH